jgi:DNA-directed RNA polymerase specialized sigma subunit
MSRAPDLHFRAFAKELEGVIAGYDDGLNRDWTDRQRKQIEDLIGLEVSFRQALVKHHRGFAVYKAFIRYIMEDQRNILAARPYFRERQDIFSASISPALRAGKAKALYKFNVNYKFIAWVMNRFKWPPNGTLRKVSRRIEVIRNEIVALNTPLAIQRARIFFRYNPAAHLEFMDFVQIAVEGLIAAVDKFVLPYSPVFRAVAIGRMTGNFIESATEPLLHFYPKDKKKAYRAHKARKIHGDNIDKIVEFVNRDVPDKSDHTTSDEVIDLMAAATHVSADTAVPHIFTDGEAEPMISNYAGDPELRPDVQFENREVMEVIGQGIHRLPIMHQKVLRLKGVEV